MSETEAGNETGQEVKEEVEEEIVEEIEKVQAKLGTLVMAVDAAHSRLRKKLMRARADKPPLRYRSL